MWALAIYPLGLAALIMLILAEEDYRHKGINHHASYLLEALLAICIILNFYFDWELSAILAGIGIIFYLLKMVAIPKLTRGMGRFMFHQLDKEIFLLTLVGWPFVSLFAFLGNQLANIFYSVLKRRFIRWSAEMPELVVYGIIWAILASVIIALYVH